MSGSTRPAIAARRVLLPQPEGPTRATNSPGAIARSTPASTSVSSKPWRTVLDNAALGARLAGRPGRAARGDAREILARLGLAGFADHYPHALSGGMRQRLALARTMLAGADGWLLDEPLGALDALTRADLQGVLQEAWADARPTTVLVTHDLDEALLLADRVVVSGPRPARLTATWAVSRAGRGPLTTTRSASSSASSRSWVTSTVVGRASAHASCSTP